MQEASILCQVTVNSYGGRIQASPYQYLTPPDTERLLQLHVKEVLNVKREDILETPILDVGGFKWSAPNPPLGQRHLPLVGR